MILYEYCISSRFLSFLLISPILKNLCKSIPIIPMFSFAHPVRAVHC